VTRSVHFDEPASAELEDAVRWYESRREGLGAEFFETVSTALSRIAENSSVGQAHSADGNTRRMLLERFPYQVVYRIRPHDLVIVAVAHLKRRPGYWKNRR
jgi:plasmid stabilization system protein ParE